MSKKDMLYICNLDTISLTDFYDILKIRHELYNLTDKSNHEVLIFEYLVSNFCYLYSERQKILSNIENQKKYANDIKNHYDLFVEF